MDQPFVTGSVTTASGQVPRISDSLTWSDHWGTVKARVGMNRMHYQIDPGLYAMGNPKLDWCLKTEPEPGLNGRALNYPRGKVLGGCSSINGMIA